MHKKEKIISLNDFKENRKLVAPDGTPYTGVYTDYYDWENDQKEREGFFKDGTEVDDPRTELDENELLSPSSASAVFIKEFCLTVFYAFLGVKLSSYIFDVWL